MNLRALIASLLLPVLLLTGMPAPCLAIATRLGYDALNRLQTVTDAHLGATAYSYDAVGNLKAVATPNGVTHGYGYDSNNRLRGLSITSLAPGLSVPEALANYAYVVAPNGQRTSATEAVWTPGLGNGTSGGGGSAGGGSSGGNLPTPSRFVAYGYDSLHRLTAETISSDPLGKNGQIAYGYDAVGNRLSRNSSVAGVPSQSFAYDNNDRLSTDRYDNNGNTIQGTISTGSLGNPVAAQTVSDTYDSENRLVQRNPGTTGTTGTSGSGGSGTVTVLYDGDGNKVSETVNGVTTTYLIDDRNPTGYAQVVEEQVNHTVTRTYTFGLELVSEDTYDPVANQWHALFMGYDGHGSVRLLTDETGAVTDSYTYDAFGLLIGNATVNLNGLPTPNTHLYCGEQYDAGLGLYYLRARYLNAANGRFWTMTATMD